jgi:OHCU decarboxylase
MTAARPFDSAEAMAATADAVWWSLDRADWLEAFAAHPRIGEIGAGGSGGSRGSGGSGGLSASHESGWATREQAGVTSAPASVRERLAAANREYDARFGYIFIVCATGKSADEMLAMLDQRLTNDPEAELRIAAEEQRKITQLRLSKLLK